MVSKTNSRPADAEISKSEKENFLGYEEISPEEREEINRIKKEMDEGKSYSLEEVFE